MCQPYIETLKFNIAQGRYTPGEIATIINDEMGQINTTGTRTRNDPQNGNFCVESPFLTTARQIVHKTDIKYPAPNTKSVRFFPNMVPGSGIITVEKQVIYNTTNLAGGTAVPDNPAGTGLDLFVGAEQASLNFDPVLKKLNFDILHTPIYVGGTVGNSDASPGVQFNEEGGIVNVYGGVAFTRLTPVDFWNSQLGFVDILVPWENSSTSFNDGGANVFGVKFTPIVGQHITGVFDNMDIVVPKDPQFFVPSTPYVAPPGVIPGVKTSLTKAIIANRQFDVSNDDEGYFLIEIGFKFPQELIGGSITNSTNASMNNIQSIVGKYYTGSNNFLQDTGAGSITYEHHGEPQLVSDLTIRVLQPDGHVPDPIDLGPKNSIFLEIIKTLNIEPESN